MVVDFLVDFFDSSDFASLKTDFGLSIGDIDRDTHEVFLNAVVSVHAVDRGHISRHFRSAWWPDFCSFCIF